ncbi:MAG: hypothetical protein GWP42_00510, partial [Verrucomicrobiales bacterium]|nr:hypothetical protein [Verrucomicrobiales bacterium]
DPLSDTDNDGSSAISEYAVGTDPNIVSHSSGLSVRLVPEEIEGVTDDYFIIDVKRRIGADDVILSLQLSDNLTKWDELKVPIPVINSKNNRDGTETISYLIGTAEQLGQNVYFRGVISLKP